ncbi:MAG: hypothetical protein O9296_09660 [Novosphingobium sp.]|nr:hypothetical protein [Novosphingobium sp.]
MTVSTVSMRQQSDDHSCYCQVTNGIQVSELITHLKDDPMKLNIAIAAALAIIPFAAMASTEQEKQVEARFKAADANHDGRLTKAEAQAGMPRVYPNFDRLDTAKRGYLTLPQIKAAIAAASR